MSDESDLPWFAFDIRVSFGPAKEATWPVDVHEFMAGKHCVGHGCSKGSPDLYLTASLASAVRL